MGTVKPVDDFQPEEAATALKYAMKGFGVKELRIGDILGNHSYEQRNEIQYVFKMKYGMDLVTKLKDELGGCFEDVVVATLTPPRLFDAREIKRAVVGLGTDENTLIEIMYTRSNAELMKIREHYKAEFQVELEMDLIDDTSGPLRRLMVLLCKAERDESNDIDKELAKEDANEIKKAGKAQWESTEAYIIEVLCQRSFPQLRATFDAYESEECAGKDIKQAIKESGCSQCLQDMYSAILKAAEHLPSYFAWRIHQSESSFIRKERNLIRQIVSRSEIDMVEIKKSYRKKYKKSLEDAVETEWGRDCVSMLLVILKDQVHVGKPKPKVGPVVDRWWWWW